MGLWRQIFYNSHTHKWLDDILMYSIHYEGKSKFAERFIRTLKNIIYKKRQIKSYLRYLNKLVDKYNNTYYNSVVKKSIDADYSVLTEETESDYRDPKTKVDNIIS